MSKILNLGFGTLFDIGNWDFKIYANRYPRPCEFQRI